MYTRLRGRTYGEGVLGSRQHRFPGPRKRDVLSFRKTINVNVRRVYGSSEPRLMGSNRGGAARANGLPKEIFFRHDRIFEYVSLPPAGVSTLFSQRPTSRERFARRYEHNGGRTVSTRDVGLSRRRAGWKETYGLCQEAHDEQAARSVPEESDVDDSVA